MPNLVFGQKYGQTPRDHIIKMFKEEGIDARVFFWPLSSLTMFDDCSSINEISYAIPSRSINLPSYHDISLEELARVIGVVDDFINKG
jgi:perosamine synthetase